MIKAEYKRMIRSASEDKQHYVQGLLFNTLYQITVERKNRGIIDGKNE
jgi:hypothetical protein